MNPITSRPSPWRWLTRALVVALIVVLVVYLVRLVEISQDLHVQRARVACLEAAHNGAALPESCEAHHGQ